MDHAPRWAFLGLTIGVLVWSLFNVPTETTYYSPDTNGTHEMSIVHSPAPLWELPQPMSLKEFAASWGASDGLEINPAGRVELHVHWDFLLTGLLAWWVIGGSLLWPVFLLYRSKPAWARATRFSLGLFTGTASCFLLWLLAGGWGPPLPTVFASLGIVLGWLWARRVPLS